jgi:hypothetical protein
MDQEMRELALKAFRDTLTDANAKSTDKLRAAEGVLRLEQEERDLGRSELLDASDEELLKRARGEPPDDGNPAK